RADERRRLDGSGEELCPPPRRRPHPRAPGYAERARAAARTGAVPPQQSIDTGQSRPGARGAAVVPRRCRGDSRRRRPAPAVASLPGQPAGNARLVELASRVSPPLGSILIVPPLRNGEGDRG